MFKSKITEYLEKAQSEKTLIQANVDRKLAEAAKLELDKHGISWSKFIIACLQQYLDEEAPSVDRAVNNAYETRKEKRK